MPLLPRYMADEPVTKLGWWIIKLWRLLGWVCLRLTFWPWLLGQMEDVL